MNIKKCRFAVITYVRNAGDGLTNHWLITHHSSYGTACEFYNARKRSKMDDAVVMLDADGMIGAHWTKEDGDIILPKHEAEYELKHNRMVIEAIRARIKGEFDNPNLKQFGDLSPHSLDDILDIIGLDRVERLESKKG